MKNSKVVNATATATAATVGSAAVIAKKGPTLVVVTQKLIDRKLATKSIGGDYAKLVRKDITGELVNKHNMSKGQASTYYHNELRARSEADPKVAESLAGAKAYRAEQSAMRKAKAAKKSAPKATAAKAPAKSAPKATAAKAPAKSAPKATAAA